MNSQEKNDDSDLKKELIVSNYTQHYAALMAYKNRIDQLRQWEITLLAGIFGYAMSNSTVRQFSGLVIAILFVFAMLEILIRGRNRIIERRIKDLENYFAHNDGATIMMEYKFPVASSSSSSFSKRFKAALISAVSADFLAWNTSLAIVIGVLIFIS